MSVVVGKLKPLPEVAPDAELSRALRACRSNTQGVLRIIEEEITTPGNAEAVVGALWRARSEKLRRCADCGRCKMAARALILLAPAPEGPQQLPPVAQG